MKAIKISVLRQTLLCIGVIGIICISYSCNGNNELCSEMENVSLIEGKSISAFTRIEDALQCAQLDDKLILVQFLALRSVNSRNLREEVLMKEEFIEIAEERFINCVLWLDSRESVREKPTFLVDISDREFRAMGYRNTALLIKLTKGGSDPVLVILNKDGELVREPLYYPFTMEDFEAWTKGKR